LNRTQRQALREQKIAIYKQRVYHKIVESFAETKDIDTALVAGDTYMNGLIKCNPNDKAIIITATSLLAIDFENLTKGPL